jgi:hypothetical protein
MAETAAHLLEHVFPKVPYVAVQELIDYKSIASASH